jgi:hypothetical protein
MSAMIECDGCGRRCRPYRTQNVIVCGEVDDVFHFCFLCVKESERAEARAMREWDEPWEEPLRS